MKRNPPVPLCAGLPEEVGITRSALQRGWAAVAFSSLDRQQRCWDPHVPGHDVDTSRDIPAVHFSRNMSPPGIMVYGKCVMERGRVVMFLQPRDTLVAPWCRSWCCGCR